MWIEIENVFNFQFLKLKSKLKIPPTLVPTSHWVTQFPNSRRQCMVDL